MSRKCKHCHTFLLLTPKCDCKRAMADQLPPVPTDEEILAKLKAVEDRMITLNDYITSSGKYKDRATSPDLTDEIKSNANLLITSVNAFLAELDFKGPIEVSSGFRTSAANASANGAKRSLHMSGLAIDISDPNGDLDEAIKKNPELLDKFGLWLESPMSTPGWTHLDMGTRSDRPIRIFLP